MQIKSSVEAFAETRRSALANGGNINRTLFIGKWEKPATVDPLQPQAYIVDQDPATVVEPHYHQCEQWQVVVQGEGTLGRYAVKPIALHYTDPYTAYGPIRPSEGARVAYFSMRAKSDVGAQYLHKPGMKEAMKPSRRRFLLVDPDKVGLTPPPVLAAMSGARTDVLIERYDDGVTAEIVRMGPGERASCLDPATGGGQYLLVVNGAIVHDGATLPYCSCVFVSPDDAPATLEAGPAGAEVMVLQYPRLS